MMLSMYQPIISQHKSKPTCPKFGNSRRRRAIKRYGRSNMTTMRLNGIELGRKTAFDGVSDGFYMIMLPRSACSCRATHCTIHGKMIICYAMCANCIYTYCTMPFWVSHVLLPPRLYPTLGPSPLCLCSPHSKEVVSPPFAPANLFPSQPRHVHDALRPHLPPSRLPLEPAP